MRNRSITIILTLIACSYFFHSCGTIWGGSTYKAKFEVKDSENVSIYVNNKKVGVDKAYIEIPRNKADRIDIALKKSGYEDYSYHFTKKSTRVVPAVEAVLDALGVCNAIISSGTRSTSVGGYHATTKTVTIYIPIATLFNLSFGSYYKPDHRSNPLINKMNYDYFIYTLSYPYDTNYNDSIYQIVIKENLRRDSIYRINRIETLIQDSINEASNRIENHILSDTNLISEIYSEDFNQFTLYKYVNECPHEYFPDTISYLKVLIPELDEVLFNPLVDLSFQSYYERIYSYSNKKRYTTMNYLAYKYQNNIVEYKGIKMQKLKNGKPDGFVKIGTWIYYFESGEIKEIVNYNISGKKHGLDVIYNIDGQVEEYRKYVNGVQKEF